MNVKCIVIKLVAVVGCWQHCLAAPPVRVVPKGAVTNPRQPQAAVDEKGAIYVAFGAGETVYCTKSIDSGVSFSDPVALGEVKKLALGMRRGPRIVAGGDAVVVTAVSHQDGDVLAWRSADGGQTWSEQAKVNDNSPGTASEGLHGLAMGPKGEMFCVWLDHRIAKGNQIFGAGSLDGGKTWGENLAIYRSPSGQVCPCCHPSVTYDAKGGLHVMWRNELDGFRDMYAATSTDGGKTFATAAKLGSGGWQLDACPMDGGSLAAVAPGKLTTVWRRERQVYRTDAGRADERLVGDGEQPSVAANELGAYLVWITRRPGDLMLLDPRARRTVKLASRASDPVIAASPAEKGPVVVVWETGQGKGTEIMAMVVSD